MPEVEEVDLLLVVEEVLEVLRLEEMDLLLLMFLVEMELQIVEQVVEVVLGGVVA
jgi:hypothetical protein